MIAGNTSWVRAGAMWCASSSAGSPFCSACLSTSGHGIEVGFECRTYSDDEDPYPPFGTWYCVVLLRPPYHPGSPHHRAAPRASWPDFAFRRAGFVSPWPATRRCRLPSFYIWRLDRTAWRRSVVINNAELPRFFSEWDTIWWKTSEL